MNLLFRLLLSLNATSLLVFVYLVQNNFDLYYFFPYAAPVLMLPGWISFPVYLIVPVLLTGVSIEWSKYLAKDSIQAQEERTKKEVLEIELANNIFLPSYLGYFFVALSISSWEALFFVYSLVFIFTFLSQALYFNPLFLVFGFDFYTVKTVNGASIFLISRSSYKTPNDVCVKKAFSINDFTFLEAG